MRKGYLSCLTAMLLLAAAVAGCGKQEVPAETGKEAESGTSADTKQKASENGARKVVFLNGLSGNTEGEDPAENDYVHYIEEQVGIDLELITGNVDYEQKVNTMMLSKTPPDMVLLNTREEMTRWASEDMLLPLDDYLKEYPELMDNIKNEAWELCKYDGKIYGVPMQRNDPTPFLTYVRKDWLDNLGINPDDVKTIDDWYQMLKRFVTDDPDGNGIDDTYGLASSYGWGQPEMTLRMFLDSFGAARDKIVDGELRPFYILPEYKEWLKFMNKLYEEKILDPEYLVTSQTQMWEKVASGKYGTFFYFWGLQEYLGKNLPRENLVAMAPPLRNDGSEAKYIYISPIRHMVSLSADCEDPKAALDMLNWAFTEEGGTFIYAGLEEKDYDVIDGQIKIKEDRMGKNVGWRQLTLGIQNPNIEKEPLKSIMEQNNGELGIEHLLLSNKYGDYNELQMLCPAFEELTQYDLNKPVAEFADKAITGSIDIDAEWDNYVSSWRKAGGDLKIQLSTEWYNREYKK